MIEKSKLNIEFDGYKFTIKIKKPILLIFHKWETLTVRDSENSPDKPIEFDTLKEAIEFIDMVAE